MPDSDPLADRVQQLEELLSHYDHRYEQLNDAVVELRADYEKMKATLAHRIDQLETRAGDHSEMPDPDEKPPHY